MRAHEFIIMPQSIKPMGLIHKPGTGPNNRFDFKNVGNNRANEETDREYVSIPEDDIERLREKFLPDWEYKNNSLQKRFKFEDYFQVIKFLINTVKPQEELDHHADIGVFYDEVLVKIYTHRTKDVSDYDFMVALQIDMIAKQMHGAINPEYELDSLIGENFADGKKKGKSRPGRVKKSGASCNGSVTSLRARAKKASGEKAKMYHWCANMKSGRKKK